MTTQHLKKSISRSPLRLALLLVPLAFACFALSPSTQAEIVPGDNTSDGKDALQKLKANIARPGVQHGRENTAIGFRSLAEDLAGSRNTATGASALDANAGGNNNTAAGVQALTSNTYGNSNTAVGNAALASNNTGDNNIALGDQAGRNIKGSNNIDIGHRGVAEESGTIRIGNTNQTRTFITGISGAGVTGAAVQVNAGGQLGIMASSARFKDEIKPMDKASEAILVLKPVTFRYKHEIDLKNIPQFGLVAEEVEKVNPDLVVRDKEGKPYTVRYEAVNAMLLNEFLKEHRKVEQLTKDFQSKLAEQQKQIEGLTTGLQKVSAQLAASKPAPQVVNNP